MIGRLHGRGVFNNVREQGVRVRAGWLWCSMVIDPAAEIPHVGYAVGRAYGNAVARNRLRRQLRVAIAQYADVLPAGWYLVGVSAGAGTPTWTELVPTVRRLTDSIRAKAASA